MAERVRLPLVTERLLIRPLQAADADSLYELFSDPDAMQYLTSEVPTRAEAQQWVQDKIDLHDRTGLSMWAVVLTDTGQVIGDAGLQRLEDGEKIEVGVRLIRRFWGHGYGREAGLACIEAGFRDLGLTRVVGITAPDNIHAIEAMRRGGMREAGVETHYGRQWAVFEIRPRDLPRRP